MDEILPAAYPLSASHAHRAGCTPIDGGPADVLDCAQRRLCVESWRMHLRTRPAELYLGAWTKSGQLEFFTFYDGRVFDSADIIEWMGELREAVKWYLGEHRQVALSKL